MKTLIKVIAVMLLASLASCVHPDPTPDKHETAAVANTAGKAVGTVPVFVFGVVTWPVGIVLAVQPGETSKSRTLYAVWPFTWTYIYWTDALPQ